MYGRMNFYKWLVDLSSISGAVLHPTLVRTSETLVIIYQTTFLHKAEVCNLQIILHAVLGIRKVRREHNTLTNKNQCKIVKIPEGK
jgi:hypothetical protein